MISNELKDLFTGKKRKVLIETLEIVHEDSSFSLYLCKYKSKLNLTLEDGTVQEFTPSNFVVKLPKFEENGTLDISVSFSTVKFSNIKELDNIMQNYSSKIKIIYRFYVEGSYKYPHLQAPFKFSITEAAVKKTNITLKGSLLLSIQTKIPSLKMTTSNLPGLQYE